MTGVLSNGKFGYHRGELARSETDAIGAGLNLRGSGEKRSNHMKLTPHF